jgi:phage baseplate assembly protein W
VSLARYLGKGWAFPVLRESADDAGSPFAEGTDKVQQAIRIVLETEPGERIMRPTFGCGLRRYLMKPNTVATRALIQNDVTRALGLWEPRIELRSVTALPGDDPALVYIAISYVHVRDGRPGNLVYPFYLE